jgi:hypothetical protein
MSIADMSVMLIVLLSIFSTTFDAVNAQTFAQICASLGNATNISRSVLYGQDTCLFVAGVSFFLSVSNLKKK